MDDVYIGIALDDDFEPGNHSDDQAEIDEAVAKINAGEWAAYKIGVVDEDGRPLYVIGNFVADSGYENIYSEPAQIKHAYLREQAQGVLSGYLSQNRERDTPAPSTERVRCEAHNGIHIESPDCVWPHLVAPDGPQPQVGHPYRVTD